MHIDYLDNSTLILRPKPSFFVWLGEKIRERDWEFENIYFQEHDAVFVIPSVDSFSTTESFDSFIHQLKPLLLQHGISGYGFPLSEYSAEAFDKFFTMEMRNRTISVRLESAMTTA